MEVECYVTGLLVRFYIPSSSSVVVVWCGGRSYNESLPVHIMLHSSEISFRCVAQGGFSADTILYYSCSYGYGYTAYGVWGIRNSIVI